MTMETTAEASELGLAPGHWPDTITVLNNEFTKAQTARDQHGDITHVKYVRKSITLVVLND